LAYIQGRFTLDTYVRRYIRVHVCYTHPYIPTLLRHGSVLFLLRIQGRHKVHFELSRCLLSCLHGPQRLTASRSPETCFRKCQHEAEATARFTLEVRSCILTDLLSVVLFSSRSNVCCVCFSGLSQTCPLLVCSVRVSHWSLTLSCRLRPCLGRQHRSV